MLGKCFQRSGKRGKAFSDSTPSPEDSIMYWQRVKKRVKAPLTLLKWRAFVFHENSCVTQTKLQHGKIQEGSQDFEDKLISTSYLCLGIKLQTTVPPWHLCRLKWDQRCKCCLSWPMWLWGNSASGCCPGVAVRRPIHSPPPREGLLPPTLGLLCSKIFLG